MVLRPFTRCNFKKTRPFEFVAYVVVMVSIDVCIVPNINY